MTGFCGPGVMLQWGGGRVGMGRRVLRAQRTQTTGQQTLVPVRFKHIQGNVVAFITFMVLRLGHVRFS